MSTPKGFRSTVKKTLNKYGIDRFSLFPGLDGLAVHIEGVQSKSNGVLACDW